METSTPSGNPLQDLSANLAAIAERVGQSVVAVHGRHRFPSSGVIWQPGVVVTAAHTLRQEDGIEVTLPMAVPWRPSWRDGTLAPTWPY